MEDIGRRLGIGFLKERKWMDDSDSGDEFQDILNEKYILKPAIQAYFG